MEEVKRPLVILDAGHGKETKGKRSPAWKDGLPQLLEWRWNRDVAEFTAVKLASLGIDVYHLVKEDRDVCLQTRNFRANAIQERDPENNVLVSIHGNAFGVSAVNGFEVFTYPGVDASDKLADLVYKEADKSGYFKMRKGSRSDYFGKEARFSIFGKGKYTRILVEAGFYTNRKECEFMLSTEGKNVIAALIAQGVAAFFGLEFNQGFRKTDDNPIFLDDKEGGSHEE